MDDGILADGGMGGYGPEDGQLGGLEYGGKKVERMGRVEECGFRRLEGNGKRGYEDREMEEWDVRDIHCFVVPTTFLFLGLTVMRLIFQLLPRQKVGW